MQDHVQRMLNEARGRIADADLLGELPARHSDSDAFLRILGFEILLKCALFVSGCKPRRSHKYTELWSQLPSDAKSKIVTAAISRMPGHTDFSNLDRLLYWYQFVFERARYHYELYHNYSLEEQRALGELWLALGSPTEEALVQYYPMELTSLIYGLERYIEDAP